MKTKQLLQQEKVEKEVLTRLFAVSSFYCPKWVVFKTESSTRR